MAKASIGPQSYDSLSPKFRELTENLVVGDIWERPGLSKRDRALITVAALVATNQPAVLRRYIQRALRFGVTKEELSEAFLHLAFYGGWPNAVNAFVIAKEVFDQGGDKMQNW